MQDLLIFLIYAGVIMVVIGAAAALTLLAEKNPAVGRVVDRILDKITVADEFEYEDEEEGGEYGRNNA